MMLQLSFLFLALQFLGRIGAELFTSTEHLQNTLFVERDIANLLKDYVKQEEARLETIKKLAEDYESHAEKGLEDTSSFYLSNPVRAFLFIKRFTVDWEREVSPVSDNSIWTNMFQKFEQTRKQLPKLEDLQGVAKAIMLLQDTYNLDTAHVASGHLLDIKSPVLTDDECFELGQLAYNEEDFYHAILWFGQAMKMKKENMQKPGESVHHSYADVLDYLAFSHFKMGNIQLALNLTNELLSIEPSCSLLGGRDTRLLNPITKRAIYKTYLSNSKGQTEMFDEYVNTDKAPEDARLTCGYVNNHPLLILRPIKSETVYVNPLIVIYHDAFSDKEVDTVRLLSIPKLHRSFVVNPKSSDKVESLHRISKSTWLFNEDSDVIKRIDDRMSAITGLNMDTAEALQIANYGVGGHFEPHYDFFGMNEKGFAPHMKGGNRVVTFLHYLTDVEAGGATVFPEIGVKVDPKKGSAVLWENLYRNGSVNYKSRHAGCPVLVGSKWVATMWIRQGAQLFRRPCGLHSTE